MADHPTDLPVLVVGAGLAGLWAALSLAPRPVVLIAGGARHRASSSSWAQGGIAAALGPDDSPARHAEDTVEAGAGLSDAGLARELTEAAPAEIRRLAEAGVPFERDRHGGWLLSHEAAHRHARVARVGGDRAGAAIVEALGRRVMDAGHVRILDGVSACGLRVGTDGRCAGIELIDEAGQTGALDGAAVLLATGGIGGLYRVTTNPAANLGQALAWAARLGARLRDAEFVQFHPTAMKLGRTPAPLATEALRGEGATLVDAAGRRFMADLHPDAELAPRDVVARAVHRQDAAGGAWLDARAIGTDFPQRFPTVFEACRHAGLDPRDTPIPIAPAAHYHMGGIATAMDGATGIAGLYAIGEAACTGVHGANRLASNSLLEAVVMARNAADALRDASCDRRRAAAGEVTTLAARDLPADALDRLRRAMQREAGVERDASGLARLIGEIDALEDRHGDADPLLIARALAASALARTESRGAHARTDHPRRVDPARHSEWRLASGTAPQHFVSLSRLAATEPSA